MGELRFIDLFAGIGGFRLGLERNGFKHVWSNDINKYASQIYTNRFGEANHVTGDIRTIDPRNIPSHDLLCAGFPCQAFSVAGKRQGFKDTRGTLFFEICRIAEHHRPSLLLLENVKGLLSHDGGRTFATILEALEELGYWWEYQVLNSKHFGVPQNRERVFIIGHLREGCTEAVFPITESSGLLDEENGGKREGGAGIRGSISPTIDARYGALRNSGELYVIDPYNGTIKNDESGAIKTNQGSSGMTTAIVEPFIKNIPHGYNDGFEKELPSLKSNSGAQYNELLVMPEVSNSIDTSGYLRQMGRHEIGKHGLTDYRIRRLTPVECERLQGFPDGWTEGISDTQRYKCLGNAVTVNVIEYLGELIKSSFSITKRMEAGESG